MKILFIDPVCPKAFTDRDLENGMVMGGTEATLLRVTQKLAEKPDFRVEVLQRGREVPEVGLTNTLYSPITEDLEYTPDVIITLRDAKTYREWKEKYPTSKHYLWLHDVVSGAYQEHLHQCLSDTESNLITVSQWHKNQVMSALPDLSIQGRLRLTVMYNPVAEYITRSTADIDPYKLMFISSPHKGLTQVLQMFDALLARDSNYKLYIANPGYYFDAELPASNSIKNLSLTDHRRLMQEVATSLCVFYPQTVFPETFGLIYAESNSLGTPVLAHDIGAAREVLDNQAQVIDCTNPALVLQTVERWTKGERPTVGQNVFFNIKEVVKEWIKLFIFNNTGSTL